LSDVNPETGELIVRHGKGGKQRTAYLQHGALAALRDWLRLRKLDDGPLFCPVTQAGKVMIRPMTTQAVCERFQLRARQAGLSLSFHRMMAAERGSATCWMPVLTSQPCSNSPVMPPYQRLRGTTVEASERSGRRQACSTSLGAIVRSTGGRLVWMNEGARDGGPRGTRMDTHLGVFTAPLWPATHSGCGPHSGPD
jgi:hypothetical protein